MENFENEEKMPQTNDGETPKAEFIAPHLEVKQTENDSDFFKNDEIKPVEKLEYSSVEKIKDAKPLSRGMKIFCLVLAAVVMLTAASTAGYVFGKNSALPKNRKTTEISLAARPKSGKEMTPAQVYKNVTKSVVGIRIYNTTGDYSDASGVVYSKDGYIVTNDHIYSEIGAAKFKVYAYDGTEYDAKYVAGDVISDLAVLKIDGGKFTPAVFGDSEEIFFGENVVAVGRPSSATDATSITSGIISVTKRRVTITSNYSSRLIQTDSAINPGSSGGALSDMFGHIIGITSSKLAGAQYDAVGFAIPTSTVKRVVAQLINDKKVVNRAKLGITYSEVNSVVSEVKQYGSTGLYVASVSEDSDIYGKVSEGDIITHINGKEITNDDMVLDIIEDAYAGDKITLTVLSSNGKSKDYTVTLKANVGESSYSNTIKSQKDDSSENEKGNDKSGDNSGKEFDFPFGE